MKKLTLLLLVVVMFGMLSGLALAADSPHGPFEDDTDLCAACHRAHTASGEYLLGAAGATPLCVICHSSGQGADTDVVYGNYVVDGTRVKTTVDSATAGNTVTTFSVALPTRIAAGNTIAIGVETSVVTSINAAGDIVCAPAFTAVPALADIVFNDTLATGGVGGNHANWGTAGEELLGGGFRAVLGSGSTGATTSAHMDPLTTGPVAQTKWDVQFGEGATAAADAIANLDCVDCHMPHRSSNYRMLRTIPAGINTDSVGTGAGASAGYQVQWNHVAGGTRNYTVESLFNVVATDGTDSNEGISAWCGSCHDYYYDNADDVRGGTPADSHGKSDTGLYGTGTMYLHAVDVDMDNYAPRNGSALVGDDADLWRNLDLTDTLPVASSDAAYSADDELTCLTCHAAHGSSNTMAGWAKLGAKARIGTTNPATDDLFDSFLLRMDNRGVCEDCHNMPVGYTN